MNLFDLIFPKKCLGCNKEGQYVCGACLKKVNNAEPKCPVCERKSIDGITHHKCQRKLGLDGIISAWVYRGVVNLAIKRLKYRFVLDIAEELIEKYTEKLKKHPIAKKGDVLLVPIPLHKSRKKWRGFNQAEELGKILSDNLGWRYEPDLLIRKKKTRPQTELKGKARKENIRNAFMFNHNSLFLLTNSTKQIIVLFDDVFTTGSTLREAGKVLKRKGFKKVYGMTICQ